tara:strand:+ start:1409 stop:2269 length:861 start_codon:yes stop_codon:yes gene_type:complete
MAKRIQLLLIMGTVLIVGWTLVEPAGGAPKNSMITTLKLLPDVPQVNLFEGIEQQALTVRVAPISAYNSSVFITNLTAQPLTVKLPQSVASIHILAQNGPGDGFLQGLQNQPQQQTGKSQAVGGNLTPVGNNQNFDFKGLFTIPAEKTVRLRLQSVCLEHGKPSPSSLKTYELRPIESQVQDKALVLLLTKFDPRYDDWEMMQAIAWHLSSHMEWQELANEKKDRVIGGGVPLFSTAQLLAAKKIVEMAQVNVNRKQTAEKRQEFPDSKTDVDSISTFSRTRGNRR